MERSSFDERERASAPGRGAAPGPEPRVAHWALRLALLAGAAPLVAGTVLFAAWLVTRDDMLEEAGILTIFGGFFAFALGLAACAVHDAAARRAGRPRRRARRFALVLLLANFPVAAAFVATGFGIETCYTVIVRNESTRPLEAARLVGGGCDETLGTVPPGETRRAWLWPGGEDSLELRARWNGVERIEVVEGYLTGGGYATVTIAPDGEMRVVHLER